MVEKAILYHFFLNTVSDGVCYGIELGFRGFLYTHACLSEYYNEIAKIQVINIDYFIISNQYEGKKIGVLKKKIWIAILFYRGIINAVKIAHMVFFLIRRNN